MSFYQTTNLPNFGIRSSNRIAQAIQDYNNNASTNPPGKEWGDYLFWDSNLSSWQLGRNEITLGAFAGQTNQGTQAIAIGYQAGNLNQGIQAIALGAQAGASGQASQAIAIGSQAGAFGQQENAIAIGSASSTSTNGYQGTGSIAIGFRAGGSEDTPTQGEYSIAIGYKAGYDEDNYTGAYQNSIILNASGNDLFSSVSGLFVKPVRTNGYGTGMNVLCWTGSTGEIFVNSSKTFVIDHPLDESKYLVHACLEGPEAGVYYRGIDEITECQKVKLSLPAYVAALATEFTVQVTALAEDEDEELTFGYKVTAVKDNQFTVIGPKGKFSWLVMGKRLPIDVEPSKATSQVRGDGPYTYIQKN
jgi:hypothetical protein